MIAYHTAPMTQVDVWPGGCLGAVSLTFDDGLASQVEIAAPRLAEAGLAGTFYVVPNAPFQARAADWREVARAGHEVGNHSLTHPCSRGFRDRLDAPCLERMTTGEVERDVLAAERILGECLGQGPRSFAYPCYQSDVGEGVARRSYVPVIARHFPAGRGKGERPNNPLTCDLHYLWSFPVERATGAELVGLAERAATTGTWCILTFHGVHEGHLPVGRSDLEELVVHLSRGRDRLWTAPVVEVARRVAAWREERGVATPEQRRAAAT
jgi:peptidoglycan/xylan/chitin deacetylase (PgdA/CDA1 family)